MEPRDYYARAYRGRYVSRSGQHTWALIALATISAVLLITLSGCGMAPPAAATPLEVEHAKSEGCAPVIVYDPPGFAGHTVAYIEGTCRKPYTTWTLLTDPDGLHYETYLTLRKLIHRNTHPQGPYIRILDFIAANPICFEAATADGTVRVPMLTTTQQFCDGLPR
jgi:hypothetical protein